MTDQRFCIECGKELSPGDKFCPSCGATIRSDEYWDEAPAGSVVTTAYVEDMSGTLNTVGIMTLLWSAFALLVGISLISVIGNMDALIEQLMNQPDPYDSSKSMWDYLVENGVTKDLLKEVLIVIGAPFVISGIFGFVSGILALLRKHYFISLMSLIVCVVCSTVGFVSLVIGIIAIIFLTKCKSAFIS